MIPILNSFALRPSPAEVFSSSFGYNPSLTDQEDFMPDLDPIMWVVIILGATAVSGALMLWSSGRDKKKR
jgi:hypothetical protein